MKLMVSHISYSHSSSGTVLHVSLFIVYLVVFIWSFSLTIRGLLKIEIVQKLYRLWRNKPCLTCWNTLRRVTLTIHNYSKTLLIESCYEYRLISCGCTPCRLSQNTKNFFKWAPNFWMSSTLCVRKNVQSAIIIAKWTTTGLLGCNCNIERIIFR